MYILARHAAVPRNRLRAKKEFSAKCRNLYRQRSYFRTSFRSRRGGITSDIPASNAFHTVLLPSQLRSAIRKSAGISLIRARKSSVPSAAVSAVTKNLTGIPCTSTARCILPQIPFYTPHILIVSCRAAGAQGSRIHLSIYCR